MGEQTANFRERKNEASIEQQRSWKHVSAAAFALEDAGKILNRLSNHFRHKLPVQKHTDAAVFCFVEGNAELRADGGTLFCTCSSDENEYLREIEDTIERHISGMAGVVIDTGAWHYKK